MGSERETDIYLVCAVLITQCVDTTTKLDACGGCPQAGGIDCSELPGSAEVACVAGTCKSEFYDRKSDRTLLSSSIRVQSGSLSVE
jgi:hypothetical protein